VAVRFVDKDIMAAASVVWYTLNPPPAEPQP